MEMGGELGDLEIGDLSIIERVTQTGSGSADAALPYHHRRREFQTP